MESVAFLSKLLLTAVIGASAAAIGPDGPPPDSPIISIKSPTRIALGPDGHLLVTDHVRKVVLAVDSSSLQVVDEFSITGTPSSVGFDGDRIYVGNRTAGRIEVYSTAGQYLTEFDTPIQQPSDIAISVEHGLVYVVSTQEKAVKVFDLAGGLVGSIPASGEEPLGAPTGVCLYQPPLPQDVNNDKIVDVLDLLSVLAAWGHTSGAEDINEDGIVNVLDLLDVLSSWKMTPVSPLVLVSDFGDANPDEPIERSVRIYDVQGKLMQLVAGSDNFSRPQGLAVDANGLAYVADSLLSKVLVIDLTTGEITHTLGEYGAGQGQLKMPLDVEIEPETGDVFVTNNLHGRIEAFRTGRRK